MSENKIFGGDDRLKKSAATSVRGDRVEADASRTQTDGTALNLEERRKLMRSEWNQEVLPTPPSIDGWHANGVRQILYHNETEMWFGMGF